MTPLDWGSTLGTNYVRISLTTKSRGVEHVPHRSGLNWGQRQGRNPNQAYLPVAVADQRTGFFPDVGENFLVECDDGSILQFVRAQQNGKALHIPGNNALLGEYFRNRLGIRPGDPVSIRHLIAYGRTNIDIFKTADGRFFLDFRSLTV